MAIKTGTDGKVAIGANTVANILSWKLSTSRKMEDASYMGSGIWKRQVPTMAEWSATADGQLMTDTDTNGQQALYNAFLAGTSVGIRFYIDATHYYYGDAFITKLDIDDSFDGICKVSFEFAGDASIAYA